MPKRWISTEEYYPVYEFETTSCHGYAVGPVDVSAKDMADYKRAMAVFNKMQDKLSKMIDAERERQRALHDEKSRQMDRERFDAVVAQVEDSEESLLRAAKRAEDIGFHHQFWENDGS